MKVDDRMGVVMWLKFCHLFSWLLLDQRGQGMLEVVPDPSPEPIQIPIAIPTLYP